MEESVGDNGLSGLAQFQRTTCDIPRGMVISKHRESELNCGDDDEQAL
jgi:hypothetical protein